MTKARSWSYLGLGAILFLWAAEPTLAQTTEPILRLEVGTHNAGIWGIAIDPSNRILVTGSEDKTARVTTHQTNWKGDHHGKSKGHSGA
jgi:hypothetical protein